MSVLLGVAGRILIWLGLMLIILHYWLRPDGQGIRQRNARKRS